MSKSKFKKVLVIVGPTASGKSELAVKLAKKYNGEIISADSRQVYRGMDIGTSKVPLKATSSKLQAPSYKGVSHHLIDVASPKRDYNVSNFVRDAKRLVSDIQRRSHLPIIVGGTGLWVDALLGKIQIPNIKPDLKLRARLEKLATTELFAKLKELDPLRAKSIDPHNPRRLIRALEIVTKTKQTVPHFARLDDRSKQRRYDALLMGIAISQPNLDRRIMKRLKQWFKRGFVEEVKILHARGVSWKRMDQLGLDYRTVARYVRSEIDYDTMVEQTYHAIRQYSKRQMTWFKRNKNIRWMADVEEVKKLVAMW